MGDSFRPNQRDGDRDRDRDRNRPLSLMDRMTFTNGGNGGNGGNGHHAPNSDLPRQSRAHHSEFTFQSTHPAPHFPPTGPSNTGSRGPPAAHRGHARDGPAQRHGGRGGRGGRSGRPDRTGRHNANGFRRGGFRKPAPHERALLRQRDDGVEHLMGVSEGPSRFKDLADLSNDETDGEYSGDSTLEDGELGDQAGGRHKISRTDGASRPDGNDVPKWSNPDPYTVLPPPETTGKGKDYVKIIRSAKNVDAEKLALSNAVSANDDFISFETEDEEQQEEEASDTSESSETDEEELVRNHTSMPTRLHHRFDDEGELEPDAGPARQQRKRKLHDDDNGPPIIRDWLPSPYYPAAPWFRSDAKRDHPEEWLHNEIMDFYDFVSPKPLEHQLRQDLVNRINDAIGPRALPHGTGSVLCFGSFPAGFYLPTADMDLVYLTNSHYEGGPPTLDFSSKGQHRKLLHQTSRILDRKRMSVDRPQVIAMAKVPLVKFVDSYTKLHVDISFENLSGVQAQATFDAWKQKYGPDLLHLVALIKQFLIMRGLNEVHTGGLGGFSIICLVVCYLANNERPHDFCACFMGFLDFYGNKFDLAKERIEMAPPGIVRKTMYGVDDRPEKPDGLSIQDPNRPENNISGGSHKAKDAFKAFAVAHRILQDRLKAIRLGEDVGRSILSSVLGGNYSSYIEQRRYMGTLNTRR